MAKILFVNPGKKVSIPQFAPKISKLLLTIFPLDHFHFNPLHHKSAGLASYLTENGHECDILDLSSSIPFKRKDILKKYVGHYDYIIFNTHFFHYPTTIEFAKFSKEINPNAKIIIEGMLGTFLFKEILKYSFIDYTIIGEGEKPLLQLVSGELKKSKIPGLAYKKNKKIVSNRPKPLKNLDVLPLPLWNRIRYIHFKPPLSFFRVLTSRGCPLRCSFCADSRWYGNVRFKSAKKVGDELEMLSSKKNHVSLFDLNFSISKKHVKKICQEIKKRKLEFASLSARVYADFLDAEMLKIMDKAGFTNLYLGIESLSPNCLRFLNKTKNPQHYISKIKKLLKLSKKLNLEFVSSYLIPLPGQKKQDVIKELYFIRKYSRIDLNYITPFPGTPLWKKMKDKLITKDLSLFDLKHLVVKSNMTEKEIKEIKDFAYPLSEVRKCCEPCPLFFICYPYFKFIRKVPK